MSLPPTTPRPDFTSLTLREMVRLRPGMYIGGTDARALHHMAYEVMDYAIAEALNGGCTRITLTLKPDGVISIQDNGPGLRVENYEESGQPIIELIMTELHGYEDLLGHPIPVAGGLHGVGLPAVNMLSEWMIVEIARDGYLWRQTYDTGFARVPIQRDRPLRQGESTGTTFTFRPDPGILIHREFDFEHLAARCRELSYQLARVTITLRDERHQTPREEQFFSKQGLASLIDAMRPEHWVPLHPVIHRNSNFVALTGRGDARQEHIIGLEFAFQFTIGDDSIEINFTNTVPTVDGGTHLEGMRSGIIRGINRLRPPAIYPFQWQDIAPGVVAAISIRHPVPHFESPTRVKLSNPEIKSSIIDLLIQTMDNFAADQPVQMRRIIDQCIVNRGSRGSR